MTHSGSNYAGYTIVDGFTGNNHKDLKLQIDTYLKELMEFINEPTRECEHCKGAGFIIDTNFDKNKDGRK
jgi:hypothetical protein